MNIEKKEQNEKREALIKCKKILEPFGEFIIVTEEASITHTKGPGIIKDMRELLRQHEIKKGQDPNHDWSKEIK